MSAAIVGLASIAAFFFAFHFSGLVNKVKSANVIARETLGVIKEEMLEDEEKEQLVQRASLQLFAKFFVITITALAVLLVPGIIISIGDLIGFAPFDSVYSFLLSWEVIVSTTLIVVVFIFVERH